MATQRVKDIGTLSGPVLVFGGVYSNLQALVGITALAEAHAIAPGNIICTGDVVGYCGDPEAVVARLRAWGIRTIAGNVELQLRDGEEDCGCDFNDGGRCDIFSRQWYPFAQRTLSAAAVDWMHELPHHLTFTYAGRRVRVVHGSVEEVSGYVFASTPWAEKARQLDLVDADVILAGHSGLPFSQSHADRYWLNAGVIGMPANDGTPRVWYMILNDADGTLTYRHHAFTYDHAAAAARMRALKLPEPYSLTLETGLWDNCEILPAEETAAQGIALTLEA